MKRKELWWVVGLVLLVAVSALVWFISGEGPISGNGDEMAIAPDQAQPDYLSPVYTFDGNDAVNADPKAFLKDLDELAGLRLVCNKRTKSMCRFFAVLHRNIPGLRKYVLTGLSEAKGKQIDFVLFYHGGFDTIGSANAAVVVTDGYRMTSEVLEKISPGLTGIEGCYSETCAWETELADVRRFEDDAGLTQSRPDALGRASGLWRSQTFYPGYAEKHPDAIIVGVDDYYSHSMDQLIMMYDYVGYDLAGGDDLRAILWRVRSEYAMARMAHLLEERHKQSGAIVMGYAHGRDFKKMAKELGSKSRFFVTVPPSILQSLQEF